MVTSEIPGIFRLWWGVSKAPKADCQKEEKTKVGQSVIHEFHEFRMILEYNKLETFEDALSKREKFQHGKLKN